MSIQGIFQYIDATRSSTALRESFYVFPIVEGTHVISLALSVGLVIWFDLRLAGWILRDQPVSAVFRPIRPFMLAGFAAFVYHRWDAFLVLGAALLWKSLFLGQDDHAGARGRQYRGIPPNDRPPANGMGRGADPADPGPDGRADLPRFVGGIITAGRLMAYFLIGVHIVWDSLYPYFLWIEQTRPGHGIRESKWIFTLSEVVHLLGLTVLLGTVLILALRLFGFALQRKSVADIARELRPLSLGGLALALSTGTILFISEATKCWGNIAFQYKMLFLFLALLFQFTGLQKVARADEQRFSPLSRKAHRFCRRLLVVWRGRRRTRHRVFLAGERWFS